MQNGVAKVLKLSAQFSAVGGPHKKDCCELKKGALGKKLCAITAIGTATQARLFRYTACRLADQRRNASPRT